MACTATGGTGATDERYRWVFFYEIDGDLRYISHQDTLRLFRRALVRAEIPVRYTKGFNPHPRMTIPLPRPVGLASQAESIVIETDGPVDPDNALQRLERHTPADLRLTSARHLEPGEKLRPQRVRYRLSIGDAPPPDLESRIRRMLASDVVRVERRNPKDQEVRSVDIRPYIEAARQSGRAVEFTLRVTGQGTARPAEVAGLLGYDVDSINHRIRRLEVQWQLK